MPNHYLTNLLKSFPISLIYMQDLRELGAIPADIIHLIEQLIEVTYNTRILDLDCGKGADSIKLARAFGCKVKGSNLIQEFIDYAVEKALAYGLQDRCEFTVGDINQSVLKENGYDIVILAGYISSQQTECDEREGGNIMSVTWLQQKVY